MYIVNLSNWLNDENEFPYLNTDNDWEKITIPLQSINHEDNETKNKDDWEIIHPPTLTYADIVKKKKKKTMDLQPSTSSILNKKNNQKTLYQNNDTIIISNIATTKHDDYINDDDDDDDDTINEIYYTRKSKLHNRLKIDSLEYQRKVRVLLSCGYGSCIEAYDWEPYDARMVKTGIPSPSKRDILSLIYALNSTLPTKTGYNPPADHKLVAGVWKYINLPDRDPELYSLRKRHIQFLMESTS